MPRDRSKYPDRLLPTDKTRKQWRVAAGKLAVEVDDQISPDTYVKDWMKFWKDALDELRDQNTWEDRDVRRLAEYVEWMRLADFHGRIANADPYNTGDSGRTFAHPGFKLQQDAMIQARIVAEKLLIGVELSEGDEGSGSEASASVGPPARLPEVPSGTPTEP